jgi:hypothetical protein
MNKPPSLICDFASGCVLMGDIFLDRAAFAQQTVTSTPHLAEGLFQSGLIMSIEAAIDMALAIQEARTDPPSGCICLSSQGEADKKRSPLTSGG